jgi:hypothetical protein
MRIESYRSDAIYIINNIQYNIKNNIQRELKEQKNKKKNKENKQNKQNNRIQK